MLIYNYLLIAVAGLILPHNKFPGGQTRRVANIYSLQ